MMNHMMDQMMGMGWLMMFLGTVFLIALIALIIAVIWRITGRRPR